jgi:hypothetical protein
MDKKLLLIYPKYPSLPGYVKLPVGPMYLTGAVRHICDSVRLYDENVRNEFAIRKELKIIGSWGGNRY